MHRCARCILPASYPGMSFNADGVCTFCLAHKRPRYRGPERLHQAVAPFKNSGREYDCIVAISGGRDSAFAAHYVVDQLKLKALGYTYDNGFMPDQTKANVDALVRALGIDHVTINDSDIRSRVKRVLSAWIRNPSPAMIALLCTGCRTGYEKGLAVATKGNGVRLVVTGGGEPHHGRLKSLAVSLLSGHGASRATNGKRHSMALGFLREVLRNPRYLRPGCVCAFGREFRHRYIRPGRDYRANIDIRFVEWNEKTILSTIRSWLDWRTPSSSRASWRSDCKVHLLRQYLYRETLGFTKNDELLSIMVREKAITRVEALKRAADENEIPFEFVGAFLHEQGLSSDELLSSLQRYQATRNAADQRSGR